jgi:hypothetical protein
VNVNEFRQKSWLVIEIHVVWFASLFASHGKQDHLHNEASVTQVALYNSVLDQALRMPSTLLYRTENENALRQFGLQPAYSRLLLTYLVKS